MDESADLAELRSEYRLSQQRLESSIAAITNGMAGLQSEVSGLRGKMDSLAQAQADFTHHSTAVDRLARTIEKLIADNERRWEAHEQDNKERDARVTGLTTGAKVSWALFGLMAVVLGALASSRESQMTERMDAGLSRASERMTDHLNTAADTRRVYENRFLRNEQDIRQLQEQRGVIRSP